MRKWFGALLMMLFSTLSMAQFDFSELNPDKIIDKMFGTIESDRPGQCLNAKTAGVLALQIQTGFNYENYNQDKISKYEHYLMPTNIRLGLTQKWELNTSFSYKNEQISDTLNSTHRSGFLSPDLGIRYSFIQGDRWRPYMALQANLSFLSHRGKFQQQQTGSSFYLITSNRFDNNLSVNTNFGAVFSGDGMRQPTFPWVFNMGLMVSDKWGVFIEGFGEFRNMSISADAGFSFLALNDLQFDVYGGLLNLDQQFPHWFIEGGVSYRFSFVKMMAKKKANQFMDKLRN